MSRESILARLRAARNTQPLEGLPEIVPEFPDFDEALKAFTFQAERAGTVVLDGQKDEDLAAAMNRVLKEAEATQLCWEKLVTFERHRIPFELSDQSLCKGNENVFLSDHSGQGFRLPVQLEIQRLEDIDLSGITVSVTSAESAIAETGTLVLSVVQQGSRVLSVLPPVHLAFVSPKTVLMNHKQFFETVALGKHESAQLLVTGPSRTADIEKTLTIGVHGPKKLFAIVR